MPSVPKVVIWSPLANIFVRKMILMIRNNVPDLIHGGLKLGLFIRNIFRFAIGSS
jgi:hypothetical protein